MSGKPPSGVDLAPDVDNWLRCAKETPWLESRFKKARKAIKILREVGPSHPGFHTHPMDHLKGPDGVTIWNSYVENAAPNAWRMYWIWAPEGRIYVVSLGPHSHTPGVQPEVSRKGRMKNR